MCATCGCSDDSEVRLTDLQSGETVVLNPPHEHSHENHSHTHEHGHAHSHTHEHSHPKGTVISLEREVLAKNNQLAERVRGWLAGRDILALNLVSPPATGKTTLRELTIRDLGQ